MKGLVGYILAILIASCLTVVAFYFLGQLLSREIEISTISRKYSSIINEAEYSQFYFRKYFEAKLSENRAKGVSYETIAKETPKTISLHLDNSDSTFKLVETYEESGFFIVKGKISYNYKDSTTEANLSKDIIFKFST
ncbi:MAG: hypothetical protein QXU74_01830 [Candidatus Aenigmatarchaeota archaeon]